MYVSGTRKNVKRRTRDEGVKERRKNKRAVEASQKTTTTKNCRCSQDAQGMENDQSVIIIYMVCISYRF